MTEALTEADNGHSIELHVGDQFSLSLRESRMGGYRWTLVENGEPVLTSREEKVESRPSRVGEKNIRAWRFTAEKPGSASIQLQHRRPWEQAGSGDDFSLSVTVLS